MNEDQFWNLIDEAKASTEKIDEIPEWLERRLSELSANEIIDFSAWLATFVGRSYEGKLWAAASIVTGGLSYDGFVYFQCWLIAQGKAAYENALGTPDSLADLEFQESGKFHPSAYLEKLLYVYFWAYNKKFGKPKYAAVERPPGYQPPPGSQPGPATDQNPKILHEQVAREFSAWVSDPAKLAVAFPKLAQRFKLP